jgi:hypothetical protein
MRPSTLRRQIASAAARLIAEEGIRDYGLAKRKAARQLGVGPNEELPNNAEIEEAVRLRIRRSTSPTNSRSNCVRCALPRLP